MQTTMTYALVSPRSTCSTDKSLATLADWQDALLTLDLQTPRHADNKAAAPAAASAQHAPGSCGSPNAATMLTWGGGDDNLRVFVTF